MKRYSRQRHAFTLIELLLVMVILVVLAAVVVPKFAGRSKQARETAALTDIKAMETGLDAFEIDNGRYPSADEGLGALIAAPSGLMTWHGPYMSKNTLPMDPWGHPYNYQYPGAHKQGGYDLYSYGPDGQEGNDDITNWDQ
ncbi:MAG TPA: type II secretion system major pseudopilin GspG [Tepidisphaeraceae bacterium]|nr:type II secretion system major pseudopilin GspG [Tepidisphaeraceae bacterium]